MFWSAGSVYLNKIWIFELLNKIIKIRFDVLMEKMEKEIGKDFHISF